MAYSGTLIRSGNNAKTIKGDKVYETAIMYLAPFKLAGQNVCPMAAQAGCIEGCLNTAGRGIFTNVQNARIAKTKRYLKDRKEFMQELTKDVAAFERYCKRRGVLPAVRLNGTSDIAFETAHPVQRPYKDVNGMEHFDSYDSIFYAFPYVQFYDYTKVYKRVYRSLPLNYSLVLSYSEANPRYQEAIIKAAQETGTNIAVVYRSKEIAAQMISAQSIAMGGYDKNHNQSAFIDRRVIDGDKTDMRFLDEKSVIVGLYAKGRAKQDSSGFVIG